MKVSPIQQNFNAGELSPLLYGRSDIASYRNALALMRNHIPLVQGGLTRRSGTRFVAAAKHAGKAARLLPFQFSTTQAYILEFGDQYMRVYKDRGQVLSGAAPYEIATPYLEADLPALRVTQSADILYLVHANYAPRTLTRSAHDSWALEVTSFVDGPYLTTNATATTLALSGTSGSVTVTASAVAGINDGAGFAATDVGRLIRWKDAAGNWTWLKITARTDSLNVTATIEGAAASATTATVDWRLGVWSDTTGYPSTATFFEDRLFFAGCTQFPQRLDGSKSGHYEAFAPTAADGTVADDNAMAVTLNASDVNVIRWLADDEKGLMVGTVGGEWIVRPSDAGEALTPTNIRAKRSTTYGSAAVAPVRVGRATLFVQRAGRKVRELAYVYQSDGFHAPDLTVLSEHISQTGIREIAYQQEPQSLLWCARSDGALAALTYSLEQEVLGWHLHTLGGSSDAGGSAAAVESVAVIPAPDGTFDELWLLVQRYVNGAVVRYVEVMTHLFDDETEQADCFYVDSGLTYEGAAATTISGLDHLEGETVQILADGAVHPDVVVSGGSVTLVRSATKAHIGYGFPTDGQLLPFDAGARDGTANGRLRRQHRVDFQLHRTLGLKVGRDADHLDSLPFRSAAHPMDAPPPLFSGWKTVDWEGGYDAEGGIYWRQDQPLPLTILAVVPQMVTQER